MKNSFLFSCFLILAFASHSQTKERIAISGSRISIEKPENVLIPKHTPTLYIDSTIEFMIMEFPNVDLVKEWMEGNSYPLDSPEINETFDLKVPKGKATVRVGDYNAKKDILYCHLGDDSFGIMTSCIYPKADSSVRKRQLEIIQSMRIIEEPYVDWNEFLSFTYDRTNKMKLVPEKYVGGIRFTPDGVPNDSIYNQTNVTSLQFPPAPFVRHSKDLLLAMISGKLSEISINEVMFDGEIIINDEKAYKFWANITENGHTFEMIVVAFFDPKSSVVLTGYIINEEYKKEVYDFMESVKMKRDGY